MKARRCIEVMITSRGPIAFFVRKISWICHLSVRRGNGTGVPRRGPVYQFVPMFNGHAPL